MPRERLPRRSLNVTALYEYQPSKFIGTASSEIPDTDRYLVCDKQNTNSDIRQQLVEQKEGKRKETPQVWSRHRGGTSLETSVYRFVVNVMRGRRKNKIVKDDIIQTPARKRNHAGRISRSLHSLLFPPYPHDGGCSNRKEVTSPRPRFSFRHRPSVSLSLLSDEDRKKRPRKQTEGRKSLAMVKMASRWNYKFEDSGDGLVMGIVQVFGWSVSVSPCIDRIPLKNVVPGAKLQFNNNPSQLRGPSTCSSCRGHCGLHDGSEEQRGLRARKPRGRPRWSWQSTRGT
jgi:hypothetical protein